MADRGCQGFLDPQPLYPAWPKKLVNNNIVFLNEECVPTEMLDRLIQNRLLNSSEKEIVEKQLRDPYTTTRDINRDLLTNVFPRKGPGAFDLFAHCLYYSGLRHVLTGIRNFPDANEEAKFKQLLERLYLFDREGIAVQETNQSGPGNDTPVACTKDPYA